MMRPSRLRRAHRIIWNPWTRPTIIIGTYHNMI